MFEESIPLDEITLDFIKFGLRSVMPQGVYPQKLQMDSYRDYLHNWVVNEVSWMLLGKKIETRKYPATWWDAFKNRWYPKFLKKRFPVNWDHFNLYNICPHINHAFPDNQTIHFDWIKETKDFQSSTPTTKTVVEIKDECEYWKIGHVCTHEENDNGTCTNEENCPKFRTSASKVIK